MRREEEVRRRDIERRERARKAEGKQWKDKGGRIGVLGRERE